MNTIRQLDFTKSLFSLLRETFESSSEITMYLDSGTDLFATLERVDANTASRAVIGESPTVAGHTEHIRFYLEFLDHYLNKRMKMVEWKESWAVTKVDEPQWLGLKRDLRETYGQVKKTLEKVDEWDEFAISGALGIVVHSAYHLSAIRQLLKQFAGASPAGNENGHH